MRQLLLFFFLYPTLLIAQTNSGAFNTELRNDTFAVDMHISLGDSGVVVPNMEFLGPQLGYLYKKGFSYCWVILEAEVKSDHQAELVMVNESGSEDLIATLTQKNDSTYVLQQVSGSKIKVPNKGKWQKIPDILTLKSKKN